MLASCSEKMLKIWSVNSTGTFDCLATMRGHSKDNSECTCNHTAGGIQNSYKASPGCVVKGHTDT